jgi:acyl-CoA dehydrogenase
MDRRIFREEHDQYRKAFRSWLEKTVVPYRDQWEEANIVPREVWASAGKAGFLCPWLPEQYGGAGADFLYQAVLIEEVARVRASGLAFALHSDIVVPYLASFGSDEQKQRWLPKCASGECITAIAMTEPNTGSDLAAIRTTALREGDHYVVNGSKTFISNGHLNDLCIVAVKTDPNAKPAHAGVSLLVVERGMPGYVRGKLLKKMGMHAQDTSELHFENCRVPVTNLLGAEGQGFGYLMQKLQQERLVVAIGCQAGAEESLRQTLEYVKERKAFGKTIGAFQNTQFKLVECATEVEVGRHFLDRLIEDHAAGKFVLNETCMAKAWHSDMLKRVVDTCLQFYGGYGYIMEYEICKAYLDARVQSIFAGTNEIMKLIVARNLGLA